jgi:hypothetical protein
MANAGLSVKGYPRHLDPELSTGMQSSSPAPIFSPGSLLLMLGAELGSADYAWRCIQELSGER